MTDTQQENKVGVLMFPDRITVDMLRFARTDDLGHFASNLNAMQKYGYCSKCGMTPKGCEREGCRSLACAIGEEP